MRALVSLSAVLVCGVAFAQQTKVTVQIRAAAAPQVVDEIARQTGLKLTADRNMWKDYLCVSVKDVPVDELLAKVAEACQARWSKSGDTSTLLPDYDLRKRAEAEHKSKSIQGYRANIQKMIDSLDPKPPKKEQGQGATPDEEEGFMGPAGTGRRLLTAYVRALGPGFFAGLEPDSRVVMSSAPTRMQTALPNIDPTPFIAKWITEWNQVVAVSETGDDVQTIVPQEEEMKKIMKELGIDQPEYDYRQKKVESMPVKLLLVVSKPKRWGNVSQVNLHLAAFDRAGKAALTEDSNLSDDPRVNDYGDFAPGIQAEGVETPKPKIQKTKINWSEGTLTWNKVYTNRFNSGGKAEKTKEEDLDFASDMVHHDPLGFVPTDFFFDQAERNGVNIVASLPDMILTSAMYGRPDNFTVERLTNSYFGVGPEDKRTGLLGAIKTPGWWVVYPSDAEGSRRNRIDRATTTKVIQQVRKGAWLTLDDYAEFVASASEDAINTQTALVSPLMDTSAFQNVFGSGDNDILRLWGMLDRGTRTALRRGDTVTFAALPRGAQQQLEKAVFGADSRVQKLKAPRPDGDLQIMNTMAAGMMAGFGDFANDLADEPTEFLPTGLDMRGRLTASSFGETYLMGSGAGFEMMGERALGLEELGLFDIMSSMPDFPKDEMQLDSVKFRVGKRSVIRLRIEVAPSRGLHGVLMDPQKPGGEEFTMSSLPPDLRAELDRKKALIKASPFMKLINLSMQGFRGGYEGEAPPP